MRGLETLAERENLAVVPLHGSLTGDEQDRAIRPDPGGRRKIIVSTNIAETSLTIEGVGVVIDSGLARVAGYDPQRGLDRLDVERISRASATQRAGRAGRTGPGVALRLWSEKEWDRMAEFETPETQRVDLCATVLELHAWGKRDAREFGWYQRPDEEILKAAEALLSMLGALDGQGNITPVGRRLAGVPVHPRLGRLLVAAAESGLPREGATLAALISERDIVRWERNESRDSLAAGAGRVIGISDLLLRLEMVESGGRDPRVDSTALRQVLRLRDELQKVTEKFLSGQTSLRQAQDGEMSTPAEETLLKLAVWAYPDRVCRRRGGQDRGVMVGGGGVRLSPDSVVKRADFFVAVDPRHDDRSHAREAFVRIASAIEAAWLEEMFPTQIRREREVVYDESRERVVGVARLWYRDLLLREDKDVPVDAQSAAAALREIAARRAPEIFRGDEDAQSVLARVALLREKMPEHPWPAWDDAELAEILLGAAPAAKGLDALRALPLASILKSSLRYPLDRLLETEAPESLEVPSGSRIRLRYSPGGEVVLSVRLQELFGWPATPRIAGGRVPVKLELLAPNYRPVQVTSDLASFWANTYFQVRKDLKARYPRHAWPEDPLTAKPEAKGGRKKS
jgi:ATP-dependent helicase HrpB